MYTKTIISNFIHETKLKMGFNMRPPENFENPKAWSSVSNRESGSGRTIDIHQNYIFDVS